MRKILVAVAFTVGAFGSLANAGPDATANRFMEEAPSMLDWGIFRLETYLNGLEGAGDVIVNYRWDENEIVVSSMKFGPDEEAEKECRKWIHDMRVRALVTDEGGLMDREADFSFFASFFQHIGFQRTISGVTDEESTIELDKLIVLEQRWWNRRDNGRNEFYFRCHSRLRRGAVSVELYQ